LRGVMSQPSTRFMKQKDLGEHSPSWKLQWDSFTVSRRTNRRVAFALVLVAAGSTVGPGHWTCSSSSCFTGGYSYRRPERADLAQRKLLGNMLDPSFWQQDSFVGDALNGWAPKYPPKTEVTLVEIEPSSGRYWPYLRPSGCKWYMDEIFIVGENVFNLEPRITSYMKTSARDLGAAFEACKWSRKAGVPPEIQPGSVDLGLISDGTCAKLGTKGTEAAMRRMFIMLKNSGRFFIVATDEDEQFGFQEQLVLGFEPAMLKKIGWQIQAVKRDEGIVVAYLAKRPGTGKKVSSAKPKRAFG